MEEKSIWMQKSGRTSNNACPLGTKSGPIASAANVAGSQEFEFELRFHVPLDAKFVISETFFPANLLASTEEAKPNTTKSNNTKIQHKMNTKNKARFGRLVRPLALKRSSPSRGPHGAGPLDFDVTRDSLYIAIFCYKLD